MSSEWPSVRLGEHAELLTGFPFKSADYVATDHAVRLLRGDNIGQGRLRWEDAKRWPVERCDDLRDYLLEEGDVVLAMDRPWIPAGLKVAKVRADDHPALLVQRVARLRPKLGLTANFLHCVVASPAFTQYIQNVTTGTAVPHISASQIREYKFKLPDLLTQTTCGDVLMALDDRIALLREANATLEAIAQALFKSWFVDFDPVRAKQQGLAPLGMDEATVALFPNCFEESAIGPVPEGWQPSPLYDMATYINGAAYKAFEPNADRRGRPIIKIAELKSGVTAQTAFSAVEMHEKYRIKTGDILFSWSGNPDTSIDTFVWPHQSAWLNQHIFRVLPHTGTDRAFVLQLLRHLRPVFAELARNKQTTGLGHVTVADMKRLLVVKPKVELLAAFDSIGGSIHSRIFANEQQAQTLATLRDTLLPRLISGQLRVPQAEAELAEATA